MPKYVTHTYNRSELDCNCDMNLPVHKFCTDCGYCVYIGCTIYESHENLLICSSCSKTYELVHSPFCPHDILPLTGAVKPRGGHPRFYELVTDITDLHDRKNTDYASGTKEGPLGNFERVSTIMKLYPGFDWDSPFGVSMLYMLKQLDAAFTLRSQGRESVTGEGIASRLKDVTVYSLIGQIQVEEEKPSGKN